MNEDNYSNNGWCPGCQRSPLIIINCSTKREHSKYQEHDCRNWSKCHCCPTIIINCECCRECSKHRCCQEIIINCQNNRKDYMDFDNNAGTTSIN